MSANFVTAEQLATKYHILAKTIREYARKGILPVVMLSARCLRFDPVVCEPILNGSEQIRNEGRPRQKSTRRKVFNATVRPFNDPSRPRLKWVLNSYHPTKRRHRAFFKTKEAAESEASARRIEFDNFGLKATDLTSAQRVETIAALDNLKPYNVSITEVVNEFINRRQGSMATFGEVAQQYLDSRRKLECSARYLSTLGPVFARLSKTFGDRRMSEISAAEFQAWIEDQGVGARTRNHFRTMLHSLFKFALRRKVIKENVINNVERYKVKCDKVGILTSDQMKALLAAAANEPDVLATLVIGAFAGLRPEEIARLQWGAINLEHGQIDCSAAMTKTARHRYVKIEPVLAAWIKATFPDSIPSGLVQKPNFRRRYDTVRRTAGFKVRGTFVIKPGPDGEETASADEMQTANESLADWPHDALRHSYASYHLAKFKNAAELSLQLGHEGTTMLFQNYRARVTEDEAEAWWALTPTTAGERK